MQEDNNLDRTKAENYVDLMLDDERLVKASEGIIRKKKSPLALSIKNGNHKAIIKAAKSRVFGSLSKVERRKICKLLCEVENQLRAQKGASMKRELLATAIMSLIGAVETVSGIMIAFLWVLKEKIAKVICKCPMDGSCTAIA